VVRNTLARQRPKSRAALGTHDPPKRRPAPGPERPATPARVGHHHLVRNEHLAAGSQPDDRDPGAEAHGTPPADLSQTVDEAESAQPEAGQTARDDALGARGRRLFGVAEPRPALIIEIVVPVCDRHVATSLNSDSTQ
jgi:hypothetical protein